MKNTKNIELDVDFVGGGEPLTLQEKELISSYIRLQKERKNTEVSPKRIRTLGTNKRKTVQGAMWEFITHFNS